MPEIRDLTGMRFGQLTVLHRGKDSYTPKGRRIIKWTCKCDCGNVKDIATSHLVNGDNVSCGCFHKKRLVECGKTNSVTHGMSRSRIYHIYQMMKWRCENPKGPCFANYGGRGIKVSDEWNGEGGFEKFYDWSLANGYSEDKTIDRIDVNGNYEPSNCRWADWETQYNNTTKTVKLTYNGKTQSAAQWARELGLDRHTLYTRIKKGLTTEQILAPRMRAKANKTQKAP